MKRNHTGHRMGQDHHRAKVSDEIVKAMRADYIPHVFGYRQVGEKYGVPKWTARDI